MDTEYRNNFLKNSRWAQNSATMHCDSCCDKNSDWKSRCMLMFTITFFGRELTDKFKIASV